MKKVLKSLRFAWIGTAAAALACGGGGNKNDGGGGATATGGTAGAGTGGSAGSTAGSGGMGMGGTGGGGMMVDPSKRIDEIDAAESMALCQAITAYADQQLPASLLNTGTCVLAALTIQMHMTETACQTEVDTCLMGPLPMPMPADCSAFEPNGMTCDATVGEVDACTRAVIDASAGGFQQLTCGLAGQSVDMILGVIPSDLPAECDPVETKCPDLINPPMM